MDAEFINITTEKPGSGAFMLHYPQQKSPIPVSTQSGSGFRTGSRKGHVFRKLNAAKATVFIEYAPLETAWVPIIGDNFYYVYCLWVLAAKKGKRIWQSADGVLLGRGQETGEIRRLYAWIAKKQKAWLSDQAFAKKFGFEVVDTTEYGYELLAVSFDKTVPKFAKNAKSQGIESKELTIYYDMQCPYVDQTIRAVKQYCETNDVPVSFMQVDTLPKSKGVALCVQ